MTTYPEFSSRKTPDFNPQKAAKAQRSYCATHDLPLFAPVNGRCDRCGYNIYLPSNASNGQVCGVTVERAAAQLITGCPHCGYSFVD